MTHDNLHAELRDAFDACETVRQLNRAAERFMGRIGGGKSARAWSLYWDRRYHIAPPRRPT